MKYRKYQMSAAAGMVLFFFAVLLAWNLTPAEAAPTSTSQDPAQYSTAVIAFVKVDPVIKGVGSGTDTLLFIARQQAPGPDKTGTSSAIAYKGFFYDFTCVKGPDIDVSLTTEDVKILDVASTAAGNFGAKVPGVVLFRPKDEFTAAAPKAADAPYIAVSALVIDLNFIAVYERQGSPLLNSGIDLGGGRGGNSHNNIIDVASPVWGGFSTQPIDDWYVQISTFRSMFQFLCPGGGADDSQSPDLASDMFDLRTNGCGDGGFGTCGDGEGFRPRYAWVGAAFPFPNINTYAAGEKFIRSQHDIPCYCNTDTNFFAGFTKPVDYSKWDAVLADMAAGGFGTFHLETPIDDTNCGNNNTEPCRTRHTMGWRTISVGPGIWWDGRLRTVPTGSFTTNEIDVPSLFD